MGIELTRASGSDGEISVYCGKGVKEGEQVIFANYIYAPLVGRREQLERLRYHVSPYCYRPKGNREVLMKKRADLPGIGNLRKRVRGLENSSRRRTQRRQSSRQKRR
jgi:hypothetical protein